MKHKGIIKSLCALLQQGLGINEACAELGLTTDYFAKRCRRIDRAKLRQAHSIYREGLQREIVQRARLGRDIMRLERALDNLPPLSLPGDAADEEREWRRRSNRARPEDEMTADIGSFAGLSDFPNIEDDETETVDSPAVEAPSAPRRRLQANDTSLAPQSPQAVEEAHQRAPEPEPAPKLRWFRLFTGRAQLRDEDGKVIRTVTPGTPEYPSALEFVNWN